MLKGFTAPRSPLGIAALVPSPPWHFAGDVLAVEFWNDPEVSVHTFPTGVELDRKRPGHSVALFTDYQFTAQNNEHLDPARYQCRGFSVLLDAMWTGSRIAWCPYCYVDNDAALIRGWIQGYSGLASPADVVARGPGRLAKWDLRHVREFTANTPELRANLLRIVSLDIAVKLRDIASPSLAAE